MPLIDVTSSENSLYFRNLPPAVFWSTVCGKRKVFISKSKKPIKSHNANARIYLYLIKPYCIILIIYFQNISNIEILVK